jgi:hypothetical protein
MNEMKTGAATVSTPFRTGDMRFLPKLNEMDRVEEKKPDIKYDPLQVIKLNMRLRSSPDIDRTFPTPTSPTR